MLHDVSSRLACVEAQITWKERINSDECRSLMESNSIVRCIVSFLYFPEGHGLKVLWMALGVAHACPERRRLFVCGGSTLWIIAAMGSSAVSSFRELTGRPEEGKVGLRIWSLVFALLVSALKSAVLWFVTVLISIKIMMMVVIIKLSLQRSLWRKTSPLSLLSRSQRYAKGRVPASRRGASLGRLHQLLRWMLIKFETPREK